MFTPRLQSISILLLLAVMPVRGADLEIGRQHEIRFRDVDGNDLSTADGLVTVITVATRENEEKARAVANQVPDRYLGDPRYRYITLVNFQGKLAGPLQGLTRVIIRRRLDAEAKELLEQYEAKKIARDPRKDIFVVADFDGSAATRLGLASDAETISVFVFNRGGKLIQRWNGVPPGDSLGAAIAAAD